MLCVGIERHEAPVAGRGPQGYGGGEPLQPFAEGGGRRRALVRMQLRGEAAHRIGATGQFGLRHELLDAELPQHGGGHRLRGCVAEADGEWAQGWQRVGLFQQAGGGAEGEHGGQDA